MAFEVGTIGTALTGADEQGARPVQRIAARLRLTTWIGLTTDCFSAASGVFVAMPFEADDNCRRTTNATARDDAIDPGDKPMMEGDPRL